VEGLVVVCDEKRVMGRMGVIERYEREGLEWVGKGF
jgi:hypothetical protein